MRIVVAATVALAAALAAQPPASEDVEITLERTACFGTCPVYSVRISGDGDVHYVGREYVRIVGPAERRISTGAVQQLVDIIQKVGYFDMAEEYRYLIGPDGSRGVVSDLPTTTTSVRIGSRTHRVVDYVGAPEGLHDVERAIDRTAGTAEWISAGRHIAWRPIAPGPVSGRGRTMAAQGPASCGDRAAPEEPWQSN
jgi:hypothetical protein